MREIISEQAAEAETAQLSASETAAPENAQGKDQAEATKEAGNTDTTMTEAPSATETPAEQTIAVKPEQSAAQLTTSTASAQPEQAASTPASTPALVVPASQPKERSLEELKDRYFSICRRLIRNRPASDENAKNSYLHSYIYEKGAGCILRHLKPAS